MDIEECKKHFKEIEPDQNKIKSIIKVASAREKALVQIKKDEETASIIVEGYYEIVKELLVALLLKNSLKSDNHECSVSYFKDKYPEYEYEANTIHQLKDIRNRINYDGLFVKPSYLEQNELEFKHIIKTIKELL